MSEITDAGNQPEKVNLNGLDVKVSYPQSGNIEVQLPENISEKDAQKWIDSPETQNQKKALASSNEKWRESKELSNATAIKEKELKEREERLQKLEAKFSQHAQPKKELSFSEALLKEAGVTTEEEYNDFVFSNPFQAEQVRNRVQSTFQDKRIMQSANTTREMSVLDARITANGHNINEVNAWAKQYGMSLNSKTYELYGNTHKKVKSHSNFDDVHLKQEQQVTFVRGKKPIKSNPQEKADQAFLSGIGQKGKSANSI